MLFFGVDLRILVHLRKLWNSVYDITRLTRSKITRNAVWTPNYEARNRKKTLIHPVNPESGFLISFSGWEKMIDNGKMKFETTS